MRAAVVSSFGAPPRCQEIPSPTASGEHEVVVDVLAAGLHPRVRSQADGSHYTSTDQLPLVPGIDGVGRGADGLLRYFILPDTTIGSMAEQTVIDVRRSILLPDDANVANVAAAMNPAMSSWVALHRRIRFVAGQDVLILGATGNAGRIAVQIAARLGARAIVAAGRDADRLTALRTLGATDIVRLGAADNTDRLATVAADVDVVLDYLWGEPAVSAMISIVTGRADRARPLAWIQIGSVAGPTAAIPSAALRASALQIVGSGQGSVTTDEIVAELPRLADELSSGDIAIDADVMSLADVERAWNLAGHGDRRIVIAP